MAVADIKSWITASLATSDANVFSKIVDRLEVHIDKPCTNIHQFKERSTTSKGAYFETLCKMYLEAIGYQVWTLKELPRNMSNALGMPTNDVGIDLVAISPDNKYVAVQVKYRRCTNIASRYRPHGKTSISWSDLSTFYALCARTGPWHTKLVMTNCDFVNRKGLKDADDSTIAGGTWASIPRSVWNTMCGNKGHSLISGGTPAAAAAAATPAPVAEELPATDQGSSSTPVPAPLTRRQISDLRMAFYDKPLPTVA